MKVTEIKVTAGRTFNHPHESYSNLRPEVTMTAAVEPGADVGAAVKELQAQAEGLVEDHKAGLLRSIEELHQLNERAAEMRGLQQQLQRTQDRLNAIRREHPELPLLPERGPGPAYATHSERDYPEGPTSEDVEL